MNIAAPWQTRPKDVFNLFNPAFCGEILRRSIYYYEIEKRSAFPTALIFLILPLVLDKFAREKMPARYPRSTRFLAWLQNNPGIRIGFSARAREMVPFTIEALLFLITKGAVSVLNNGDLKTVNYRPKALKKNNIDEINDCFKKAQYIGKWFSEFTKLKHVYQALWVKP